MILFYDRAFQKQRDRLAERSVSDLLGVLDGKLKSPVGFCARVTIVDHADTSYDDLVVLHLDEFPQFRLATLLTQALASAKFWHFYHNF